MTTLKMALDASHGVRLSQTSPAFLHANSTSHTWTFSAIAELVDNAYDPDVSAEHLWIDKKVLSNHTCVTFTDDGNGCAPDKLHKMLSFGYCEKVDVKGHKPIGHYGNGFKSGSMRLGKDAMVFTKSKTTMSVGFLSQTFLEAINAETVLVPIVTWLKDNCVLDKEAPDAKGSLEIITRHSLFRSEKELMQEFKSIRAPTGTRIILYNLKRGSDEKFELDFESDKTDIINSEHQELDFAGGLLSRPIREHMPEYRRSLREYLSILFLKPKMKITLRGSRVKTKLIKKSLRKTRKTTYTPSWMLSQGKRGVDIFFGFGTFTQDYGCMMYHRNRLIKAYEHVGYQKQANDMGVGVVSVVEVDFLEPIHNKQDFSKTDRYNACMSALGLKLNQYWNMMMQNKESPEEVQENPPDWTWAQCELCLKWRRLPDQWKDELPEKWYCRMNPDMSHNRCDIDEEPEDEDEVFRLVVSKNNTGVANNYNANKTGNIISPPPNILNNNFQNVGPGRPPLRPNTPLVISPLSQTALRNRPQNIASRPPGNVQGRNSMAQVQPGPSGHGNSLSAKRKSIPLNVVMFNRNRNQPIKSEFITLDSDDEEGSSPSKRTRRTRSSAKYTETKNTDGFTVLVLESSDEEDDSRPKSRKRPTSPIEIKPSVEELDMQINPDSMLDSSGSVNKRSVTSEKTRKVAKKHTAPRRTSTPVVYTDIADDPAIVNDLDNETPSKTQPKKEQESKQAASTSRKGGKTGTTEATSKKKVINTKENVVVVTNTEVEESLKTKLAETKNKLTSLRSNIQELLKILVPDLKLESPELVDRVIVEMIHVNAEQGSPTEARDGEGFPSLAITGAVSAAGTLGSPKETPDVPETPSENEVVLGDIRTVREEENPDTSVVSESAADQLEPLNDLTFSSETGGEKDSLGSPTVLTVDMLDNMRTEADSVKRPPSRAATISSDSTSDVATDPTKHTDNTHDEGSDEDDKNIVVVDSETETKTAVEPKEETDMPDAPQNATDINAMAKDSEDIKEDEGDKTTDRVSETEGSTHVETDDDRVMNSEEDPSPDETAETERPGEGEKTMELVDELSSTGTPDLEMSDNEVKEEEDEKCIEDVKETSSSTETAALETRAEPTAGDDSSENIVESTTDKVVSEAVPATEPQHPDSQSEADTTQPSDIQVNLVEHSEKELDEVKSEVGSVNGDVEVKSESSDETNTASKTKDVHSLRQPEKADSDPENGAEKDSVHQSESSRNNTDSGSKEVVSVNGPGSS